MLTFHLTHGTWSDFSALQGFHYRAGRPATVAAVFSAYHLPHPDWNEAPELAAVAVLSYPTLRSRSREAAMSLLPLPDADRARFLNRHVRNVSRLIVHPRYRGLGLATRLLRHVLTNAPTAYTEATSALAHAIPVFQNAGMTPYPAPSGRPAYFLYRRDDATDASHTPGTGPAADPRPMRSPGGHSRSSGRGCVPAVF